MPFAFRFDFPGCACRGDRSWNKKSKDRNPAFLVFAVFPAYLKLALKAIRPIHFYKKS
jgi:hypothetical protein